MDHVDELWPQAQAFGVIKNPLVLRNVTLDFCSIPKDLMFQQTLVG
jgi:hypothetical protein